jgi:6-phosphogluconolactonase
MAILRTAAAASLFAMTSALAAESLVYIGTYTNKDRSKGIYAYRFNDQDGKLTPIGLVAETPSPSFLAIHPSGKFLYAVNEIDSFKGEKAGSLSAFSISKPDGKLTLLNTVSTKGTGPCHVSIDPSGQTAMIANYGGGSIASYGIGSDGKLTEAVSFIQHSGSGANPGRQRGPHAHSINVDASRGHAIVADLGLDKLFFYKLDSAKHTLTAGSSIDLPPGSGPRHFALHPNKKFGYVINEMLMNISAISIGNESGRIMQTISTLPGPTEKGFSTAEVVVHPNGKFVYGSNRGHNTIASFSVDPASGQLKAIDHTSTQGKTPRNFAIDPSGKFLIAANQDSDNIVVFRLDANTGKLTSTGTSHEVVMPVCVRFLTLTAK